MAKCQTYRGKSVVRLLCEDKITLFFPILVGQCFDHC